MTFDVAEPPPPASTCLYEGDTYQTGARITATMKNAQVDAWVLTQQRNGWGVVSTSRVRGQTTVVLECDGTSASAPASTYTTPSVSGP